MEQMTAQLVDLGMTGLLIGYLIHQNKQASTRLKALQDKYEALLERAVKALDEIGHRL